MNSSEKRFAEALFEIALDKNMVKEFKDNVDFVYNSLNSVEDANTYLIYDGISKNDKKKLISNAFKDSIDRNVLNFIYLLIDKGYIAYYKNIFNEFHNLCNKNLNIDEGYIYSKREISDDDLKKIENKLSSDNTSVILKRKLDDELISGFKIVLKNKVIDYSMKNKIEDLHDYLLKEGV